MFASLVGACDKHGIMYYGRECFALINRADSYFAFTHRTVGYNRLFFKIRYYLLMSSEQTACVNKHEPGDFAPQRPATGYAERKTVKIGFCEVPLFLANLFFAFLVVAGHVGQKVSLPLWVDSTNGNSSGPTVDSYFVLSFASLSFVVIFGLGSLIIGIFSPQDLGETERRFPHRLLFLVGFFNALSGLLIVFASKGARTPPYLQAILGNFLIPLTVLFR